MLIALLTSLFYIHVYMYLRPGSFSAPDTLPLFNMHLCVPILDCTPGTVGQGGPCHAVLCVIREVGRGEGVSLGVQLHNTPTIAL